MSIQQNSPSTFVINMITNSQNNLKHTSITYCNKLMILNSSLPFSLAFSAEGTAFHCFSSSNNSQLILFFCLPTLRTPFTPASMCPWHIYILLKAHQIYTVIPIYRQKPIFAGARLKQPLASYGSLVVLT